MLRCDSGERLGKRFRQLINGPAARRQFRQPYKSADAITSRGQASSTSRPKHLPGSGDCQFSANPDQARLLQRCYAAADAHRIQMGGCKTHPDRLQWRQNEQPATPTSWIDPRPHHSHQLTAKATAIDSIPQHLVGHPRLDSAPSNPLQTGPGPLRASVERNLDATVQFGGAIREVISTVGQSPSSAPLANPSHTNQQMQSPLAVRPRRPHDPSTSPAQEIANSAPTRTRPDSFKDATSR